MSLLLCTTGLRRDGFAVLQGPPHPPFEPFHQTSHFSSSWRLFGTWTLPPLLLGILAAHIPQYHPSTHLQRKSPLLRQGPAFSCVCAAPGTMEPEQKNPLHEQKCQPCPRELEPPGARLSVCKLNS